MSKPADMAPMHQKYHVLVAVVALVVVVAVVTVLVEAVVRNAFR